ncbi:LacI family DNA-binding transcriptional regulator [Falsiroseomonas sp. HW251]|uniref:LacI family DNA-binding transcriptional regulator n=1 Tax=Falsiroseomonas sp. HW251 TaxID=3390998 RepID=UPI003D316CA7
MRHATPVRIEDVAREAGVARSTAALALKGSPRLRQETVASVRAAAGRLGYVYDRLAARLRSGRSGAIGLVVCEITNPFYAELTAGVQAALESSGLVAFLANTEESRERQQLMLERFREQRVDGVLLVPAAGTRPALLDTVARWGMPCVTVVRGFRAGAHAGTDHRAGSAMATRHLIGLGHRHIAYLGAAADSSTSRQRLAGYALAMREAGLAARHLPCLSDIGEAASIVAGLPRSGPTALVCFNDTVAFGATVGLARAGRAVGRDVAVTGFDDVRAAAQWHPALTTIRAGAAAIGDAAARLLLERIADPATPTRRVIVAPELVIRSSCGAA